MWRALAMHWLFKQWSMRDRFNELLRPTGWPEDPPSTRREPSSLPATPGYPPDEGDDPHYRMMDVTHDPFGEGEPAAPDDDEESVSDAEAAERAGDRFRERARRAGPLPGSMMAVDAEDGAEGDR
ncbi:hypothetical protein WMF30_10200 [Sorangium sp. So ce134]